MNDTPGAAPAEARETLNLKLMALGPLAGLVLGLILPESLGMPGRVAAGGALWMAIWWMTEAVPIPVTSLLPLVLFPLFGVGSFGTMAAPFANAVVFLVLGGVILGLATERSNLHRRIALRTIQAVGTRPDQIVLGLMIASAFISAWISNTATAVIMVPIGVSILHLVRDLAREQGHDGRDVNFSAAVMLGIAYGVTMGSTATLIGQPPTALMKAYLLEQQGYDMGFAQWMVIGVPFAVIMLVIGWLLLTKVIFRAKLRELPGGAALIRSEVEALGPMSKAETRVAIIFLAAIFFWVAVPLLTKIAAVKAALPFLAKISSSQVAMTAAVACFLTPSGERDANGRPVALLTWDASREIPWGLLLLFGGGLSLSAAFTATGLSVWIGNQVAAFGDMPGLVVLLIAAVVGLALTELTNNTATAAAFFPIMGSVAVGMGMDPLVMTAVMTLAVCSAYMLPVATPSNAVAFGSGEVTIKQMVRVGLWLNIISLVVIFAMIETLFPLVLTR